MTDMHFFLNKKPFDVWICENSSNDFYYQTVLKKIMKLHDKSSEAITRCFNNQQDMFLWSQKKAEELNTQEVLFFLERKPAPYQVAFLLGRKLVRLNAQNLKTLFELSSERTISLTRCDAVLRTMAKWGILKKNENFYDIAF